MTVTTLTATERQTKLEALALIDQEILSETTVRELRDLVRGLVTNVTKLKKSELLELIADRTADIREANRIALETAAVEAAAAKERLAELEAAALSPATPEGYRAAAGIESFEDIIEKVKTDLDKIVRTSNGFDDLCETVDNLVLDYCDDQRAYYEVKTRKSNNTRIFKSLDLWLQNLSGGAVDDNIKTAVLRFKAKVSKLNFEQNKTISIEYKAEVKKRFDGRKVIDADKLLTRAKNVIEMLEDYRDVSIALAILTGRRMAEIMAVGRFDLSDKQGHIRFTGQAKTRGSTAKNSTEVFDIPVLADPELVLKAFWYLDEGGYRLDFSDDVNKKYSKMLSRRMVEWSTFAGVEMTYKSLRAFYASVCYDRLSLPNDNENSYFARILGHGEADYTTAFSYMVWDVGGSKSLLSRPDSETMTD
jgi:integrase